MDRFLTKLKKIIFGAPFCPKTRCNLFRKKDFESILSVYPAVTSCEKSERLGR